MPERVVRILKDIGKMADDDGFKCYLVGGVVRDILLKKHNEDIDIVVEGGVPPQLLPENLQKGTTPELPYMISLKLP